MTNDAQMKSLTEQTILGLIERAVTTVLKDWLHENRGEILQVVKETLVEIERAKQSGIQKEPVGFLTVAELAQRWHLCPETIRRMIRDGRVRSIAAGRHHRIAIGTVQELERRGTEDVR